MATAFSEDLVRRIRRTEITVETDEIVIIRSTQSGRLILCPECAVPVVMITPEQAAAIACTNIRVIYRLADEGRVHYAETAEASLMVCPRSVSGAFTTLSLPPRDVTNASGA
jgi:hypothetical protein